MKSSYDPWNSEPLDAVRAVAELVHELGVAVEIDYASDGSISSSNSLPPALSNWFYYSDARYIQRQHNAETFDAILRDNVQTGRPVIASIPGHTTVIDGVSQESGAYYYHINYGWGGQNDGWYLLDNIGEETLYSAVVGIYPQKIPLFTGEPYRTVEQPDFALSWQMAAARTAEVKGFVLEEGQLLDGTYYSNCESLAVWRSTGWQIGCEDANCFFRKVSGGSPGDAYYLSSKVPFVPSSSSTVSFRYKVKLSTDKFRLGISTDGGFTFTNIFEVTDVIHDVWQRETISLAGYAGLPVQLRFSYVSGRYYTSDGVWLDDITCTDGQVIRWKTLDGNIPGDQFSYSVADRYAGTYYYRVATASRESVSEITRVVVDVPRVYYIVTFELGAHGSRTGGGELVQTVEQGCAAETPDVSVEEGWVFSHWDADFTDINADLTVTALYHPEGDSDSDGLLDYWEQDIIDDSPNDNIATLENVQPDDDFDHDGYSNGQEYTNRTDPTENVLVLQHGWNLISIAETPNDNSPTAIFGSAIQGAAWIMHNGHSVPVNEITPFRGHWVYCPSDTTVEIDLAALDYPTDTRLSAKAQRAPPEENSELRTWNTYSITLNPGWNCISLGRVPNDNKVATILGDHIQGPAWIWNGAGFESTDHISPDKGCILYQPGPDPIQVIIK